MQYMVIGVRGNNLRNKGWRYRCNRLCWEIYLSVG